jgi:hypothetical protein
MYANKSVITEKEVRMSISHHGQTLLKKKTPTPYPADKSEVQA